MTQHPIVSHDQWLAARKQLLAREKQFTRLRDQLAAERRALLGSRSRSLMLSTGQTGRRPWPTSSADAAS